MKSEIIEICTIEEKQKLLLYIVRNFHDICEKNNLVYNLFGGTMLGAVRHAGIIPWDDDIDVTMPRKDYEEFISIVRKNKTSEFVIHSYPDENYIYPYAKFGLKGTYMKENVVKDRYANLTLNIDIFPNDAYPQDESRLRDYENYEREIIKRAYKPINNNIGIARKLKHLIKWFINIGENIKPVDYYVKKQIELFDRENEDTEYIICQGAGWGEKGKLKRELYYDRVLYDFNDLKLWGMRDYDEHLKNLYGDYMTPPPEDKRVCPHSNTLFVEKFVKELI